MSAFKKIKAGLKEAIEHEKSGPKGLKARIRTRELRIAPTVDFSADEVRGLRLSMRLSQDQFAALLGVSSETVAKWEQGHNSPARSSVRLLQILKAKPLLPEQLGIVVSR
jgi:DNA-binding transcriptional regulator YiaG